MVSKRGQCNAGLRRAGPFRSAALCCALAVAGTPACGESPPDARSAAVSADHPNIVLIIIDTLRADALGAYGQPAPTSPEIDAYARDGVRFARVVAQCTWTRPSIGSMLTSLHPRTLGLYREEEESLAGRFATLAETLREHGYRTIGATANPNINSFFHFDQGFDVYYDSDVVFPFMPGFREQAEAEAKLALPTARSIFVKLGDAIREHVGQPVFVQVDLMEVHEHAKLETVPEEIGVLSDGDATSTDARYLGSVRLVSREVGLFIRSVARIPGRQKTLFVITSDHGESLAADHPSLADPKWHGFLVYETQALVPLIFYSTSGDLPAGRVIERPVRLLDLMPTLLDYAGVPGPPSMAGVSLMPLLRDEGVDVHLPDRFVVESELRTADKSAVYSSDWIYVESRDDQVGARPRELQRPGTQADGARTDVSEQHPDVLEDYARYLERWHRSHPRAEPTPAGAGPSGRTAEQLRALGYVE